MEKHWKSWIFIGMVIFNSSRNNYNSLRNFNKLISHSPPHCHPKKMKIHILQTSSLNQATNHRAFLHRQKADSNTISTTSRTKTNKSKQTKSHSNEQTSPGQSCAHKKFKTIVSTVPIMKSWNWLVRRITCIWHFPNERPSKSIGTLYWLLWNINRQLLDSMRMY